MIHGLSLLSEQASQNLVDGLLKIIEEEVERRVAERQVSPYIKQKDVMSFYGITHKEVKRLEASGLRKFKLGASWRYDKREIEEIMDTLKEG